MSLIVACKNQHGIVLAADSQAASLQVNGERGNPKINRMFQLSSGTVMLTGGSAEGASMSEALRTFIREEGLNDIEDIYRAALPFLASAYEEFMRKQCQQMPLGPIHQVLFLLAGITHRDKQSPYRMYLLWTRKKLPQLDGDEITSVFAMPRSLKLENKLDELCRQNIPLNTLLDVIQPYAEGLSETHEEVGVPLVYGTISQDGFQHL